MCVAELSARSLLNCMCTFFLSLSCFVVCFCCTPVHCFVLTCRVLTCAVTRSTIINLTRTNTRKYFCLAFIYTRMPHGLSHHRNVENVSCIANNGESLVYYRSNVFSTTIPPISRMDTSFRIYQAIVLCCNQFFPWRLMVCNMK